MTTEWIPITDEQPAEDGQYLVIGPTHDVDILYWSRREPEWQVQDTYEYYAIPAGSGEITHWQPRPAPPVGE